ncbi:hypothetical protein TrCOL_g1610 [Triparma columacea]|uniref:Uncharacterized protein n=1 Tax=Triparma columacea TaxID=722753 RepID=A0A9W7LD95_9STRA|nr:hypothetical protein TrCOL_g1610 [Triparma columacea]
MEQVKIGELVTKHLENGDNTSSSGNEVLRAQLTTSDGIRGFFVSYLTRDAPPAPPPPSLYAAIANVPASSSDDLIDLSIMNVIMPAAQSKYFEKQARDVKESDAMEGSNVSMMKTSALTCKHGKEVLKVLIELSSTTPKFERVKSEIGNCIAAANNPSPPSPPASDVQRWMPFFDKWGYDGDQIKEISKELKELKDCKSTN